MKRLTKTILSVLLLSGYWLLVTGHCLHAAFQLSDWGSRPAGMGGTFIGLADDPNAIVYNPAGLTQLELIEANVMYARLFTGLEEVNLGLSYLAVGMPVKEHSSIGFGWANFSSMNLYQEDTFYLTYSRLVYGDLSAGVNVKYMGHRYTTDERTAVDPVFEAGSSKYAVTFDAGLHTLISFDATPNFMSLGIVARNITQPDVGLKTTDKVPMEIGIGAAFHTRTSILPALDLTYRFQEWGSAEDKYSVHLGAETWFFNRVLAIRGGGSISKLSLGFGLKPQLMDSMLQLDYTLLWPLEVKQTQGTHLISLTIRFASLPGL